MDHTLKKQRIRQIREALFGLPYWLPPSSAFLYPFVDLILLLEDRQFIVWICEKEYDEDGRVIFSSDRLDKVSCVYDYISVPYKGSGKEDINIYYSPSSDTNSNDEKQERVLEAFKWNIHKTLFHGTDHDSGQDSLVWRYLRRSVNKLKRQAERQQLPINAKRGLAHVGADHDSVAEEATKDRVSEIRRIIDQATEVFSSSDVHRIDEAENVFAVLHLHNSVTTSTEGKSGYLSIPLQTRGRRAYCSKGSIETKYIPHLNSLHPSDNIQLISSNEILMDLLGSNDIQILKDIGIIASNSNNKGIAISIPVHISGFPWISLIRLLPPDREYVDFMRFYKDVVPRVASIIRSEVKELYADSICDIWQDVLRVHNFKSVNGRNALLREFHSNLDILNRFFPYESVKLSYDRDTDDGLVVGHVMNSDVSITVEGGSYYDKRLSYDSIGLNEISRRMGNILRKEKYKGDREFMKQVGRVRHTINDMNPMENIRPIRRTIRDLDMKIDRYDEFGQHMLKLKKDFNQLKKSLELYTTSVGVAIGNDVTPHGVESTLKEIVKYIVENITSVLNPEIDLIIDTKHDVAVDFDYAFMVIWNLVDNAVKSAKQSSGKTTIKIYKNTNVKLKIENSGDIGDGYAKYLMGNRSYPEHNTKKYGGLEVVRNYVDRLGWNIEDVSVVRDLGEDSTNITNIVVST